MTRKQKRQMQYRTFRFDIDAHAMDSETGEFEGYASAFNVLIPGYNEKVLPGAFTQTLKDNEGQVPIFFNHWSDLWIGMGLEAVEDKRGLKVRGKLLIDSNDNARSAWELMKLAGEMTKARVGLSIGFRSIRDREETIKGDKLRLLEEVALMEYSVTPFPANPKAFVTGVRSIDALVSDIQTLSVDDRALLIAALDGTTGAATKEIDGSDLRPLIGAMRDFTNALAR
jgi:HK97 family phage prohead protease